MTGLGGLYLEGLVHRGANFRNFTVLRESWQESWQELLRESWHLPHLPRVPYPHVNRS